MTLDNLPQRQRAELISLAGYPPLALDDEAAVELERQGLVERLPEPGYRRTAWYRITDSGRALLPPEQHERLAATERAYAARKVVFARFGL